jgi:hypothetical protein
MPNNSVKKLVMNEFVTNVAKAVVDIKLKTCRRVELEKIGELILATSKHNFELDKAKRIAAELETLAQTINALEHKNYLLNGAQ